MTGYRRHYFGAMAAQAMAVGAKTTTMLLLSYFVDDILFRDNMLTIVPFIALGFLGLACIEGFGTFTSNRLGAQTSEGVTLRIKNYLYDHLQRQSFKYHDKQPTGDLMQRATSDVRAIGAFFTEQGVWMGRILLLFIVNVIAIATIYAPLALISSLVVPIVVLISLSFFKRINVRYEEMQTQEAVVSTRLQENLTGVRVVKAFARQSHESDRFDRENYKHFLKGRRLLIMHSLFWPLTDLLTGFHQIMCLYLGARLALDGTISAGQFIAFAGMVVYVIHPMRNMGRLIVQTSAALVSYDRVMEIIKSKREPLGEGETAPVQQVRGEVEFKNVSYEYERGLPVLKDVSFKVEPGQIVALMGATGSGKTTVINLLMRFYDYSSGHILIDGVDLSEYPRDFLRRSIGVVEQEPFLFSRTIKENITYGVDRPVSDEEIFAAAKAAAIHHVIQSFPDGYATMVGERGVTLSGGQKQRVAIARTLLKNPRILVFDDATSSVDSETEAAIRDSIKALLPGRTAFIIAHRVQTVMSANKIIVFDDGHIVQHGTHEELIGQDGFYHSIFDMQSRIDDELAKEINL
ncbi:MAG: ABC transporter ATP-binding protein [Chloroflexi bacterium]|nr:ABC transporter ATP-binding protein [Chloroflexota bacterium]